MFYSMHTEIDSIINNIDCQYCWMQELPKKGVFVPAKEQDARQWKYSKFKVPLGRFHTARELDLLT